MSFSTVTPPLTPAISRNKGPPGERIQIGPAVKTSQFPRTSEYSHLSLGWKEKESTPQSPHVYQYPAREPPPLWGSLVTRLRSEGPGGRETPLLGIKRSFSFHLPRKNREVRGVPAAPVPARPAWRSRHRPASIKARDLTSLEILKTQQAIKGSRFQWKRRRRFMVPWIPHTLIMPVFS